MVKFGIFRAALFGLACFASVFFFLFSQPAPAAEKPPVLVGFDGEYGLKNSTSAQAIELGLRAAIHEINAAGGVLGGRPVKLVTKDNRSIPSRGLANLKAFAAMPDMTAVFGGRFSPVLLQQIKRAHELKILLLDVWGAADGITDHKYRPSYTFRLSLRDSWAMPRMAQAALKRGKHKFGVLLPNTGWGRSNHKALAAVAARHPEIQIVHTGWYNWGEQDMLSHYEAVLAKGADALLIVANDIEASRLIRQLSEHPSIARLPMISHWGVTGGNMVEASGPMFDTLDFSTVQTFSFFSAQPAALKTFMATVKATDGIETIEAIKSPVGVGHAYDMMHILAKAIDKAGTTEPAAIRDALESGIEHRGLVRDYTPAFTVDRHDALSHAQVFMARFRKDGVIIPTGD